MFQPFLYRPDELRYFGHRTWLIFFYQIRWLFAHVWSIHIVRVLIILHINYTDINQIVKFLFSTQVALFLKGEGGKVIPVPSDEPYRHREAERSYGWGDLSRKHAAQAAEPGKLGKSSLLIMPRFGNRVHLVAVVTDVELAPDPVMGWEPCSPKCTRCLRACPSGVIQPVQGSEALAVPRTKISTT